LSAIGKDSKLPILQKGHLLLLTLSSSLKVNLSLNVLNADAHQRQNWHIKNKTCPLLLIMTSLPLPHSSLGVSDAFNFRITLRKLFLIEL
jgi:hypothetical protein